MTRIKHYCRVVIVIVPRVPKASGIFFMKSLQEFWPSGMIASYVQTVDNLQATGRYVSPGWQGEEPYRV